MLEIDHSHGFPLDYTEREIRSDELCKTIIDTSNNHHALPALKLRIVKQ